MKKLATLLSGMMLMMATNAMALTLPGNTYGSWSNLQGFLNTTLFPGTETSISGLNFSGTWNYTAIAAESGNYNIVETPATAGVNTSLSGNTMFTTKNTSNWGKWNTIDFGKGNLFFEDTDGPYQVALDPFTGVSDPGFKIYQLTANSSLLAYLPNSITLTKGTYIIGFNDNHANSSDSDYDDIIIAMTPVPEPGTIVLLSAGLLGLGLYGRRRMNK